MATSAIVEGRAAGAQRIGEARVAAATCLAGGGLALAAIAAPDNVAGTDLRLVLSICSITMVLGAAIACMPGSGAFGIAARPGAGWAGYYTLTFGWMSFAWLRSQGGSSSIINREVVPTAVCIATVGLAAVIVGYRTGFGALITQTAQRIVSRSQAPGAWRFRLASVPVLLYLVGTLARAERLRSGQYGYLADARRAVTSSSSFAQVLAQLELFARYGLVLATLDAAAVSKSFRARMAFRLILVVEIAISLLSGVKGELLITLGGVGVVFAACGRRPSRKQIASVAVIFLMVIPFNSVYRTLLRPGGVATSGGTSAGSALSAVPDAARQAFAERALVDVMLESVGFIVLRLREIDSLAVIVQRSPAEIPYRPARQLVLGPPTQLIPRAVWRSKPIYATGYQFAQEYFQAPSTTYSSAAVTLPGDLYRHGGVLPLAVGMTLLGMFLRLVGEVASPSRDLRAIIFYVPLLVYAANGIESDFTGFVAGLVQSLLVLTVLSRFLYVPAARSGRVSRTNGR